MKNNNAQKQRDIEKYLFFKDLNLRIPSFFFKKNLNL